MSTLLELAGFVLIVAGCAFWSVPLALVVAGIMLVVSALALEGDK